MKALILTMWLHVSAAMRWDLNAVCELSRRGGPDYHDYHDDPMQTPWHHYWMRCVRCGKEFQI